MTNRLALLLAALVLLSEPEATAADSARVRFPAARIALLGRQVHAAAVRISNALGYRGMPC